MDPLPSTSEIVEATEELGLESKIDKKGKKHNIPKSGIKCSIEDDINSLFEAIDIRTSSKGLDALRKSALKRPMRVGSPQASGIGISEPVNLKQALRGLCISQAAELAAAKRLSKPSGSSRSSEVGTMNQVYQKKANLLEISLVPEKISSNQMPEPECLSKPTQTSTLSDIAVTPRDMMNKVPAFNQVVSLATETEKEISQTRVGKIKSTHSSSTTTGHGEVEEVEITACSSMEALKSPLPTQGRKAKLHMGSFLSSSSPGGRESKCESSNNACLIGPVFRNRSFMKRKVKENLTSLSKGSRTCEGNSNTDASPSTSYLDDHSDTHTLKSGKKDGVKASPISSSTNISVEVNSTVLDKSSSKLGFSLNSDSKARACVTKADNRSRSKEKGEFSQSSISSIGEYSSSATSVSDDSSLSGSSRGGSRPHMSKDLRWEAIHCVQKQNGWLGLRHFKLLKKLGCGDIGTVYLAELIGSSCLFALKVMDNEFLVDRKKLPRAQTEREILQMLDHPFLPTLFAHFTTDKYWCLLMEYCPGGDLHVLRQKQPGKCFSEQAARFYVAEVLLALEYLHMLGVVYRDLKPENVLVREDGHIMLSDFDLSLRCSVNATLLKSSSPIIEPTKKSTPCTDSSCIEPFCLDPSWQVSCFTPKLLSVAAKSRKIKSDLTVQSSPLPQLVVEPTNARSNSFVGTHEYLAPEIVKGSGHGSAVDWWTFGIFLFELLYGRTPFKGSGNEETLSNVVSQSLRFPTSPMVSFHARDLIRGLLVKEPDNRLGSSKGATEIKQHPFFEGLNWALIRCAVPPELPRSGGDAVIYPQVTVASQKKENDDTGKEAQHTEDNVEFEMF